MPRFSIGSALIAISVAAVMIALNTRPSVSTPQKGCVHYHRGWPVYHTREIEYPPLVEDGAVVQPGQILRYLGADEGTNTNWRCAAIDLVVAMIVVAIFMATFEWVIRRSSRSTVTTD